MDVSRTNTLSTQGNAEGFGLEYVFKIVVAMRLSNKDSILL